MSEYCATVEWQRGDTPFSDDRYSRAHRWRFDGGLEVPASASPQIVPLPLSCEAAVDPEEAFVASLSRCHMLWFLSLARADGLIVDRYIDNATGLLAKDAAGELAITLVRLRPEVRFGGGDNPHPDAVRRLHQEAHGRCFIARSVRCEVRCEPRWPESQRLNPCAGDGTGWSG